jgi:hypothetical protein
MNIFISKTDIFQNEIKNIIKEKLLLNLNLIEFDIIFEWFVDILNLIYILFQINNKNQFQEQLRMNNYRDTIGIFLLLLPFINNINELKTIKSIEEIYIKKEENIDITNHQPKYIFSNLQYNLCNRNPITERKLKLDFLENNYFLLKSTLYEISNKMYVNWTNVIPMNINDFNQTKIYIETKKYFNQNQINEWDYMTSSIPNQHLQVGIIYETIINQLYLQIVPIKWLLYDYDLTNKNIIDLSKQISSGNIQSLIKILYPDDKKDTIINLEKCWNGILWNNLSDEDKNNFNIEWNNFKNNKNYFEIIRAITMSFAYYQKNKQDLPNYIPLKQKEKNQIYTNKEIDNSINSINDDEIYEFIRSSFYKFKGTIYYHILYGELQYLMTKTDNTKQINFLPKYIYNFAKSFSHSKSDFMLFPPRWKSLTDDNKKIIIERINNHTNLNEWFSIKGNIKKIYKNINTLSIDQINEKIYKLCIDNLIDIVFQCLIISGTLSVFTLEDINPKKFHNSFYFINNQKYGDIQTYDSNDNYELKPFLQFIEDLKNKKFTNNPWIDMYAMNWVSQINFFHRYINNRVIFATGGTGVGKSTQIPKLFLYAIKSIDMKDDGRIICSQPRKKPTFDNAIRIAGEMGIPILKSKEKTDFIFDNVNIQFQNHDEQFPPKSNDKKEKNLNPILKIVTDKILLNTINNPLYKTLIEQNNQKKLITKNLYDIVIVDESHEHNENMDMILTLMKRILYFNNDCKLVIISATMDDDEPIYRRFYRDINDNMMYPLNNSIKKYYLDRISVDRRLHISIPGETRRYKIETKYLDREIDSDEEKNNKIIEYLNYILNNREVGDILIFKSGQKEIKNCVQLLNQIMPNDVLAVPYYSELSKTQRDLIENIYKIKNKIHIERTVSFEDINKEEKLYDGNNYYNHIIIVATNIAEASITIDTLTDVIDDGIQKVNTYYPELNGSKLTNEKISELQRLQREGRVGRTRSGHVFYLYPHNARKNIVNNYKICINDITYLLFSYLKNPDEQIIFNNNNDPNSNTLKKSIENNDYSYRIERIMKKQYLINNEIFGYNGNETYYDYQNSEKLNTQYFNSYDYETLEDTNGKFYIIHPNELSIQRNIIGEIIEQTNDDRISKFYERLIDWFLILMNQMKNLIIKLNMEMKLKNFISYSLH